MSQAWSQYVDGSPSFFREQKFKNTKYALKNWVKTSLTTPMTNRQERVYELTAIQLGMEEREITNSQLALEQIAQFKTSQSFRQEEKHIWLNS